MSQRNMSYKHLKKAITAAGGGAHKIHTAERKILMQQWREIYSSEVKRRTGMWIYDNLDWHTFSWEFCPAKSGNEALSLYKEQRAVDLIMIPEFDNILAYRCEEVVSPDFSDLYMDLYVFDQSLDWTMAFTHEQPEIGPYFCKREWTG